MINSLQKNHKEGVSDEMCNLPTADANAFISVPYTYLDG